MEKDGYDLRLEGPIILAMIRQAANRYRRHAGDRPVNAVEVGFWLNGSYLYLWFISDPDYQPHWDTYPLGFDERGQRASYGENHHFPTWNLLNLFRDRVEVTVRSGPDWEIRLSTGDGEYSDPGWGQVEEEIGRGIVRLVCADHREAFADVRLADPCRVGVDKAEDSDMGWAVWIAGGQATVEPNPDYPI